VQRAAVIEVRVGFDAVKARVVTPAWGGQERTFLPVKATRQVDAPPQYAPTIQSWAPSAGRYSCTRTPGIAGHAPAIDRISPSSCTMVVPVTAGCAKRSHGAAFFSTTG